MRLRNDLLDGEGPDGLAVYQLTEEAVPSSHVYTEAQIFCPDSRRFILHRSAHAHGSDRTDPEHRYLLCDLADGGRLSPLTEEIGAVAPSMSPDGRWLYYFIDQTEVGGGRLTLRRVRVDGTGRETVLVVDGPISGGRLRPSHVYPISTISSDGRRLVLPAFLGDGNLMPPPWGMLVFDLDRAEATAIALGEEWGNLHAQYCRSTDPAASRDLLLQHDHGNHYGPDGTMIVRGAAAFDSAEQTLARGALQRGKGPQDWFSGLGVDVHVLRDDGTNLRSLPLGRDGNERLQGHQCWRGRTEWVITSTQTLEPPGEFLIEAGVLSADRPHDGLRVPGGVRNRLCRDLPESHFYHFATDIAGRRIISDFGRGMAATKLYLGILGEAGRDAARWTYLLDTREQVRKETQLHPFLSPDGRTAFFNSAESGLLQAYMITGLPD